MKSNIVRHLVLVIGLVTLVCSAFAQQMMGGVRVAKNSRGDIVIITPSGYEGSLAYTITEYDTKSGKFKEGSERSINFSGAREMVVAPAPTKIAVANVNLKDVNIKALGKY